MRKIIITVIAVGLLIGALLLSGYLGNSKKAPKQVVENTTKTAFVEYINNTTVPIVLNTNGNLVAKNRIELYAEVQGVLQANGKEFKSGISYKKGQSILKINAEEYYASIKAQRSTLENLIASVMPDLRLDYPEAFDKWNTYLTNFNIDASVPKLPEPTSQKEKYFLTGKSIYITYYNIKNLETRLAKYNIRAPFDGVLTETLVTKGALVRSGQKLGEFIDTSAYEMAVSVNEELASFLQVGKTVSLSNLDGTQDWIGTVSRINGRVDQTSQTIQVFIEVKGENLREGMYLKAELEAKEEANALVIDRKLLVENTSVFTVENQKLHLVKVKPVYFNDNTVVIKGLEDGTAILSKPILGAYEGMQIKIMEQSNSQS